MSTSGTDDLPAGLPDGFDLYRADRGDRVETVDGDTYVVLESRLDADRTLVTEDVVEYGTLDHPFLTGLAGFVTLLASFIMPLWAGFQVLGPVESLPVTLGGMTLVIMGAWVLSNVVLYRTAFGDQVFRFLEWQNHNTAIIALRRAEQTRDDAGSGGETA